MSEVTKHVEMVPHNQKDKLGVWFFLGGEVVLFSSLILTIMFFRIRYDSSYPAFKDHLSIPLVGLNTFILIVSSFLVVRALEAVRHGNRKGLVYHLMGVMLLGAAFVSGQAIEWAELFHEGITASSLFGTPFFTVTGIHGSHVMIGLAWASFVLVQALDGAYSERNYHGVEVFGLYWHFVDIVWIVLFSLIYLF
jgi:heme/copper-type cytochrome/quinol oxidase subunit 3